MSIKQWGHGFHAGQNKARMSAKAAAKELRRVDIKPFELIHILMNEHDNKDLVNQLHSAILRSPMAGNYSKAAWLMMDTGELEDNRPKDTKAVIHHLTELGKALNT